MVKILMMMSLLLGNAHPQDPAQQADYVTVSENINAKAPITKTEIAVREAAVKVVTRPGHGSGALIQHKDIQLVFTAEHVVDDPRTQTYIIEKFGVKKLAILVYADGVHDIAVLYLPEKFEDFKAMKFDPSKEILRVGSEVTFSGYPSNHQLMTVRGRVAGYEYLRQSGTQIIIHTYGWFGSTGSVVFTEKGKIAGILWGVDVEYPNDWPQIIEDMMWVVPIKNLNFDKAVQTVCENYNTGLRACK